MIDIFGKRPLGDISEKERRDVHIDAQSLSFYADISAFMRDHVPSGTYSLLDVGPRSGAGLALLRLLHHPSSYASIRLEPATGVDIDPSFEAAANSRFPDIAAMTGDVFDLYGSWDIVLSSHTIEHTVDPVAFIAKLRSLATKFVVIACPFEEQELIPEHRHRIGYKLLTSSGFWTMKTYRSDHWFNSLGVIAISAL